MSEAVTTETPSGAPNAALPGARAARRAVDWRGTLRAARALFGAASPLVVAYVLLIGGALGLASAYLAVQGPSPAFGVRVGAWTVWPKVGSRAVDPYSRAIFARTGEIPLSLGEGLALSAFVDDAGEPLTAACSYAVEGVTPPARYWTLTLHDEAGRPVRTPLQRSGFTSTEAFRAADLRLSIAIAREPQPGNWLQMPEGGPVQLTLRLYDTPVSGGAAALDPATLPALRRIGCRP